MVADFLRSIRLNRSPLDILDCCYGASELFQAIGIHEQGLAEVPPQYAAMFYLRHPEKPDDILQLEVVTKVNDVNGAFEVSKAHWSKGGKPDTATQAPPLDLYHIRLHRQVTLFAIASLRRLTELAVSHGSLYCLQKTGLIRPVLRLVWRTSRVVSAIGTHLQQNTLQYLGTRSLLTQLVF